MRGAKAPEYASCSDFFWVRTRGTQVRTSGTQVRTPSCWVRTRTWQASVCVVQVQVFAPLRSAGL